MRDRTVRIVSIRPRIFRCFVCTVRHYRWSKQVNIMRMDHKFIPLINLVQSSVYNRQFQNNAKRLLSRNNQPTYRELISKCLFMRYNPQLRFIRQKHNTHFIQLAYEYVFRTKKQKFLHCITHCTLDPMW